jgi:hypothetical protein
VDGGILVGVLVSVVLVAVCVIGLVATILLWRNRARP